MSETLKEPTVEKQLGQLRALVDHQDLFGAMALAVKIVRQNQALQPDVREALGPKMDRVFLFLFKVKNNPHWWERFGLLKDIRVDYPEALNYLRDFLRFEHQRYRELGELGKLARAGTLMSLLFLGDLERRTG